MLPVDRQEQLLMYVNEAKTATVEELSNLLKVSKVTVRRDLDELSSRGLIHKTYGGAVSLFNYLAVEVPSNEKSTLYVEEKRRIGKAAAKLIEDNDIIVLDAGTTTLEIARNLSNKKVTVITNDMKIAMELAGQSSITLYIAGGYVQPNLYCTVGNSTENFFKELHANKAFLGADAISLKNGITNRTLCEVPVKRAIIQSGESKIVVLDHSKFEKEVFASLGLLDEIDTIITDKIDANSKRRYEEMGIKIILA